MKKKSTCLPITAILLIFLLSVLFFSSNIYAKKQTVQRERIVSIKQIKHLQTSQTISFPANVIALHSVNIRSQISGIISEIHINELGHIDAGQTLMSLNCDDFLLQQKIQQNNILLLQEKVSLGKKQLKRIKELHQKKSISQEIIDTSLSEIKQLKLQLRIANNQLELKNRDVERCNIYAPFAGIISQKLVSTGAYITPNQVLFELIGNNKPEIQAFIPVNTNVPNKAKFIVKEKSNDIHLDRKSLIVDRNNQTLDYRFTNDDNLPAIGTHGRIQWQSEQQWLSPDYLVKRNNQLGIFIAHKQQAKFVAIESAISGQAFPINLPENTQVIIFGQHQLKDGDVIIIKQ